MLVDSFQLGRWLNVRKLTPRQFAAQVGMSDPELRDLLDGTATAIPDDRVLRLAAALGIVPTQLANGATRELSVIVMTAAELLATCRPIQRDGIHFYNYYSMAGPPGHVAPVILDILCPAGRAPQLNNGHLEPAITVNLGPGDIHGRWAEDLTSDSWRVMAANRDDQGWICGDSYVEPSFCPHSYALASEQPARIISYTGQSHLADLLCELNHWTPAAFEAFIDDIGSGEPAALLRSILRRHGFTAAAAADATDTSCERLKRWLAGGYDALSLKDLRGLGERLGFDYRILLPSPRHHEELGLTYCSIEQSKASVRTFATYKVASMASASHLPSLCGLFMMICSRKTTGRATLDLVDSTETHYMVFDGEATLAWDLPDGSDVEAQLATNSTAWVAPYVRHGWTGEATVIRLSSGRHVSYLDQLELTNTFGAEATLRRGWRDRRGWGYDDAAGSS